MCFVYGYIRNHKIKYQMVRIDRKDFDVKSPEQLMGKKNGQSICDSFTWATKETIVICPVFFQWICSTSAFHYIYFSGVEAMVCDRNFILSLNYIFTSKVHK